MKDTPSIAVLAVEHADAPNQENEFFLGISTFSIPFLRDISHMPFFSWTFSHATPEFPFCWEEWNQKKGPNFPAKMFMEHLSWAIVAGGIPFPWHLKFAKLLSQGGSSSSSSRGFREVGGFRKPSIRGGKLHRIPRGSAVFFSNIYAFKCSRTIFSTFRKKPGNTALSLIYHFCYPLTCIFWICN